MSDRRERHPVWRDAEEDVEPVGSPPTRPAPTWDGTTLEVEPTTDGDHGRIGYGRYARLTPVALAVALLLSLGAIGYGQLGHEGPASRPGQLVRQPAPDVTLTLLAGAPLRLADLRGSVVVLNFWASWCEPCRDEAPLLQALHEEAMRTGEETVVVGVGIRTDDGDDARAFVQQLGLTYPIGRDTGSDGPGRGPIEIAFGVPSAYPSTVFVGPDGVVERYHLGPLSAAQLRAAIDEARARAGA